MMPALLPSSTLILDWRAPSDSRICARLRRSASACDIAMNDDYSIAAGNALRLQHLRPLLPLPPPKQYVVCEWMCTNIQKYI